MKRVDFSNIKITSGFWRKKQDMVRSVTVDAVYNRFFETGRFDAFKCDPDAPIKPHIFWDSDVAKWIEGVAYLTKEKREPRLEKIVDEVVDNIEKNQDEFGYFNSFYLTTEKENRFTNRDCHELYCLGHLIEAAVAYYEATGKDKLLKLMCKYVDYVERIFKIEGSAPFKTPGHEEIELALVRLYECTKEERYLALSRHFVDEKGTETDSLTAWSEFAYSQSHLPVRQQKTAEGHAVRATYLYCAMADLALKYGDAELKSACLSIFENIVTKRMYITGGIGSSAEGEAFTIDYDLPNLIAYTESCAALGLALFAHRMLLLENKSIYADIVERVIYNGFMSSTSLDGKSFFYTNPLEILPHMLNREASVKNKNPMNLPKPQRQEVFNCSCCPPNVVRFIPSIANFMYTTDENTIYVHQFMESVGKVTLGNTTYEIEQKTAYPENGRVTITVKGGDVNLAVRVPGWCESYPCETTDGYAYFQLKDGNSLCLNFEMKPQFVYANPEVLSNASKCAIMRGPVVYCMEGFDNPSHLRNIIIDTDGVITEGINKDLGVDTLSVACTYPQEHSNLYTTKKPVLKSGKATFIPYYAFANRGVSEMQVWCQYK